MAKKKPKSRGRKQPFARRPEIASKYDNVVFQFPDDDMRGTVLVRDSQMVIEIPEQNGLAPCLVIGKQQGHLFRGTNEIRDEDALSISAAWCDFGEVFAGVWIEEGNELLFSFRLPRK